MDKKLFNKIFKENGEVFTSEIGVDLGSKIVSGTKFPIEDKFWKSGGKFKITRAICNGTASHTETYKTKREAIESFV